jgi:uncharacterized protein
MRLEFNWDPQKAASNLAKHGVSFDMAMGVFNDPLALAMLDKTFVENEERWVTLGVSGAFGLILVVHTYVEIFDDRVLIRIISARRPTKREVKQYQEE